MKLYYVSPFVRPSLCLYRDICVSVAACTLHYYIASTEEPNSRRIIDQIISYIILYLYVRAYTRDTTKRDNFDDIMFWVGGNNDVFHCAYLDAIVFDRVYTQIYIYVCMYV